MEFFKAAFSALGTAATNPIALVGYLAVILSFAVVARRERRNKNLLDKIEKLPEKDRLNALKEEMGSVTVPIGLTPEQWLRDRAESNRQRRFQIIVCLIVILTALAAWTFIENQKLRAVNPPTPVGGVKSVSQNGSGNDGSKKADGKEGTTKTSGKIEQHTSGNKSPAVVSNGDVNITFDK
ncbi:hypothetical protein DENIS_3735 [Desulfonema ishimotonii]|uniref:Uncharacterized protein n=1 Tax=Desulfonema ishimotonii TaxID=45657 RepID=A0A401G0K8_9BACT|nr:hypothetical protein [Desulfonema ishimotonii]GBC62758.1 hypothetical protein DENIS_3735 [Desulfonema ishimotonii]